MEDDLHRPGTATPPRTFWRTPADPVVASPNERELLDLVRRQGRMSRADLTRATGLAAQSVMRLVDELRDRGLLHLGETLPREGRGKPSQAVELVPGHACTIGFSITTDSVSSAIVDFAGNVLGQRHVQTPNLDRSKLVAVLRQHTQTLLHTHKVSPDRLFGLGVGITGFFVGEGRRVNSPSPLDDLALVDLDELLARELGHPVWLDNDGTVAAVGESMLGVGRWARSFVYLYFSLGLGGGLIVNGRCVRGAHGNAGEVAGMLSIPGIEAPTLELLREMLASDGLAFADIGAMLAQFNPHWPACDRWLERARPAMSLIVSATVALLDPDAIVYGGRLPRALAERLIAGSTIDNKPRRGRKRPEPRLVPAEAPSDATAIGAAALPFKEHFFL
ncbi:transcriptional regulator [Variovorax sp. YR266]|uniref:ROK family transcriptional regulator n=1 Tax=Variovorax sp. YR266 TaxID=1884386 RepID=UPI0008968242|nr:ROK family transcriptional regulator [Variovorax sp. YR266]SDZ70420.1 transcriptional regulator [Variovorax sp. YR266]